MGFGAQLCLCLLLISYAVVISSARTTVLLSDENFVVGMRRSLRVRTNDYDEPTANRGHDPPSSPRSRSGRVGNGGAARRG